jgi:hypothetical protein
VFSLLIIVIVFLPLFTLPRARAALRRIDHRMRPPLGESIGAEIHFQIENMHFSVAVWTEGSRIFVCILTAL